ncbi:ABC transporter ATP-binding protein [Carboxylicivirga sp. M1479]|uniref:ABC transporter ATP-binding protein n=1 Tax=Carboxylicivirga sp. M1479 TaxID=2594476 RepID=UPI0011789417|nr:ABC transporter ATP-binding protein [Carboxylicivirga sp. M1479]TRX70310.1 ABC transporter ATP-binding protein [Carboxylicivirga sp. M1479]
MDNTILLQSSDLAVGYKQSNGRTQLLHQDINVQLNQGEFACLLGPNGAGKSTLIKTLSGFIPKISGDVCINGLNLHDYKRGQLAKVVSVVLTEKLQVSNMTVFDLVALGRTPYTDFFGNLSATDKGLVLQAINDVGLQGFANRQLICMSDGERQKAMIAKALVQDTPLIILDEPTAFLDLPSKIEIVQLLKKLAVNNNKGILLSTHDLELALQLADKIWLLAQGRQLECGIPEDLVLSNSFKSFFEKEGVLFDNESGSFRVQKDQLKTIQVIGEGVEYQWLCHALNRIGFQTTLVEGDYPSIKTVENANEAFVLNGVDGHDKQFKTIEELLCEINIFLKSN